MQDINSLANDIAKNILGKEEIKINKDQYLEAKLRAKMMMILNDDSLRTDKARWKVWTKYEKEIFGGGTNRISQKQFGKWMRSIKAMMVAMNESAD